jgi:hypothetical protein
MPMMTLNRKHNHMSLNGYSVCFVKNEPVFVPKALVQYAIGIGAQFVEDADKAAAVIPENTAPVAPPEGDERKTALFGAFAKLVARNGREDFTAAGLPNVKALETLLGFDIDSKERNALWGEYQAAQAGQ